MNYPTITDYLNSIEQPNCFNKLNVKFLKESKGLIYFSGRESLIFKVEIDHKLYSLKVYTSYNKHRNLYFNSLKSNIKELKTLNIADFEYFNNEVTIYVDGEFQSYPALLAEWIEGETLSEKVKKFAILGLKDELHATTDKFISFAKMLINSKITHIDLKPENIIIDKIGCFRLIDIDALYFANYTPKVVSEQGTEWYRHPNRKEQTYSKFLHDYPIAIILCSLLTLEHMPEMYELYSNDDNLIFSPYNILRKKDKGYIKASNLFKGTIYQELFSTLSSESVKIEALEKLVTIISYVRLKKTNAPITEKFLTYFDEYVTINKNIYAINYMKLWSFISSDGRMITPFVYSKINRLSENKIVLQKDNLWHIYDEKLSLITSFTAEDATFFSNDRLAVKLNTKWGYMNSKAEVVIDFRFETAKKFDDNLKAEVKENNQLKEIDINGK